MQLANSILLKNIFRFLSVLVLLVAYTSINAQDNSPYSRYGLGDKVPSSNITTRGMAGISAAYA